MASGTDNDDYTEVAEEATSVNGEFSHQNAGIDMPLVDIANEHPSEDANDLSSNPDCHLHQSFERTGDLPTHEDISVALGVEMLEEPHTYDGVPSGYREDGDMDSQQTAVHGRYDIYPGGYLTNTNAEAGDISSGQSPEHEYPDMSSESLVNLTTTSQVKNDTDIEDSLFVSTPEHSISSIDDNTASRIPRSEHGDEEFSGLANKGYHDHDEYGYGDNAIPSSTNSLSLEDMLEEDYEDQCSDHAGADSAGIANDFIPSPGQEQQNRSTSIYNHRPEQNEEVFRRKKRSQKRKTGPRAKTAREWFSKRNETLNKPTVRTQGSKRKHPGDLLQGTSATSRKQSKKSRITNRGRKKNHGKGSKEVMEAMLDNLRNNNPIEARIELGDLPDIDPITAKTKTAQFQQLVDAVPQNVDKRSVGSDKKKLTEASRSFGYGNCIARDGKWLVKGMKTFLHAHQVIASSWMLNREFSNDEPFGGILADEMGMGKTLETLGCIVSNKPTEDARKTYHKATLIVAPATAVKQWEDEIKKHTERTHIKGVLIFKQSQQLPEEAWENMDIIIASYHEVSRQYPSKKSQAKVQNANLSEERKNEKLNKLLGPLFKTCFWRIVLDEAHQIKNDKSQMSSACRNLKGRFRWAISGTPITNTVDEIYPYLKFLVPGWDFNLDKFQYIFGNLADNSTAARLGAILSTIMIRRTSKDRFMGQPLYTIPLCHPEVKRVNLTKEERVIYEMVEKCYRGTVNREAQNERCGGREDYLQCILRLRQGAAHPLLLEPVLKTLPSSDIIEIQTRLAEVGGERTAFKQVKDWCTKVANEIGEGQANGLSNSQIAVRVGKLGYTFNMDKQLDMALASKNERLCRICYEEPEMPQQAECSHIFCKECAEDHVLQERQSGKMPPACPECDNPLIGLKPWETESEGSESGFFDLNAFLASEGASLEGYDDMTSFYQQVYNANPSTRVPLGKDGKRLGHDFFNVQPKLKKFKSTFLLECDKAYPEPVVPSSKTIAVKEAVLQWQAEAPDDKIIIFTQFKLVGAIIGRMLQAESIPFLYFFGDMSQKEKNNALTGFKEHEEVKVMIASLKCGGVALNLTCANRVILVDLWWNCAVEHQAFARVFRMGQTKETHFLRIVSQNTVDQRIERLQAKKLKEISKVFERGASSSGQKLATEELFSLFGLVKENGNGDLEVVEDYSTD